MWPTGASSLKEAMLIGVEMPTLHTGLRETKGVHSCFLLVARCALFLVCVFCLLQFSGAFVNVWEVILCTEIG